MCHRVTDFRFKFVSMVPNELHGVIPFLMIHVMSMNLSLRIYTLLYITLFYMVLLLQWWELYFSFCQTFPAYLYPSPPSMNRRSGGKLSAFLFVLASMPTLWMWLMNDLTWSGPNHLMIFTESACCLWLVHWFLSLYFVIWPTTFTLVCYITGCMNHPDVIFPALKRQALAHWCLPGGAYGLLFVGVRHFHGYNLHTNVLQSSSRFFSICSQRYSSDVIVVLYMCLKFCVISLSISVTYMV